MNRKGIKSTLIALILLSALFIIIAVTIIGQGLPNLFEKLNSGLFKIPDSSPDKTALSFAENNDNQLKFLKNLASAMQTAQACKSPEGSCILPLPSPEQDGFYSGAYNLRMEQSGKDIILRLTRSTGQDYESNAQKIEAPVGVMTVTGAQLCIIKDSSAQTFYDEFDDIKKGEIPNGMKVTPIPAASLILSSTKDGGSQREIGFKLSASDKTYTWKEFFKRGTKTTPYVFKTDWNGVTFLCFFPAVNEINIQSICRGPIDGFMQLDCFDSDNGKRSIGGNFNEGLIPGYYNCADKTVSDSDCLCGGTKNGGGECEAPFTISQCQCAASFAKNTDPKATYFTAMSADTSADKKDHCIYTKAGCNALLVQKPDFIALINQNKNPCANG